jgi:pyruvate-ferredoxin/flavodoxin oxidoreductase
MGASDAQTVRAFVEAQSYPGPSLIIAYSHCIAHGINMRTAFDQQKLAVNSGAWSLYRYDPRLSAQGKNPLQLDSKAPSIPYQAYSSNENRYKMLELADPDQAKRLIGLAQQDAQARWNMLSQLAGQAAGPVAAKDTPATK